MKEQCKNCIHLAKLYVSPIYDLPKDKWVCTLFLDEGQVMYLDSDKDMCEGFTKRERHCVNCRHNIRKKDENGNIYCECEIEGGYISYVQSFEGWCRRWAKEIEEETIKEDKYPCYTCTLDCDTTCEIYKRWLQKTAESEEEE